MSENPQGNVHLLVDGDNLIVSMPEINRYINFAADGAATNSTKTPQELLELEHSVFESEIYSRIDNAIAYAATATEADRIFKAELGILKALVADKNFGNES